MRIVWVTGVSGTGKSTVCDALKAMGVQAIDADFDGFNHWVDNGTGEPVVDPPYPTPADWLDSHSWHIRAELVRDLCVESPGVVFLFGAVNNEHEVWDCFDRVGCLVADDETIRHRLATRTNNTFGKHAADLDRVLAWNRTHESSYRRAGAMIIDGTAPIDDVIDAVLRLGDDL